MRGQQSVDTRVPFVGRVRELERLAALLHERAYVLLLGAGGAGKSRLALEASLAWERRTGNAAVFVALADVPAEAIASAVASALDIPELAALSPLEALSSAPLDHPLLVVFDNCEDAAATIRDVIDHLRKNENICVLATSRVRLWAGEEVAIDVGPFSAEDGSAFFAARAMLSGRLDDPRIENRAAVSSIVKSLDGLAVAIDLAAAKLASLNVAALAAELSEPRPYHFRSSASTEPRHWTINRVVDWSLAKLDATAQRAFAIAGRFANDFDADDVAAILQCPPEHALALLESLAEHSLIGRVDGSRSYGMLAPIRSVARRRLERRLDRASIDERFARRMTAIATELKERIETPAAGDAVHAMARRYEDFTATLAWGLESPSMRVPIVFEVFCALISLWADGGRFDEGLRWCDRIVGPSTGLEPVRQGRLLYGALRVAFAACEYERMLELGPKIITAFSIAGDRLGLARAYNGLGVASTYTGRFEEAITYVDTALALYETIGHERGIASALMNRGAIALEYRLDAVTAADCYKRALEIVQRSDSDALIALAHGNLAEAYDELHDVERTRTHARLALERFERTGDCARSAWQHHLLARAALADADARGAAAELIAALELLESQPNPTYLALCAETAARMLADERRVEEAAVLALAAERLRRVRRVPATGVALRDARTHRDRIAQRLARPEMKTAAAQAEAIRLAELPAIVRRALAQTAEARGDTMVEGLDDSKSLRAEQEH